MEKQAIKEIVYGGISEMMKNRLYYYHSDVGSDYCHWTDAGKIALHEFTREITKYIWAAENEALDKRAVEITLKKLGD